MPIYVYHCDCGNKTEAYRKIKDRHDAPECHGKMTLKIVPTFVYDDIQPYQSHITGEMITSKSQHKAHLKQHDCIEVGNEPPPKKRTFEKDDFWNLSWETGDTNRFRR